MNDLHFSPLIATTNEKSFAIMTFGLTETGEK